MPPAAVVDMKISMTFAAQYDAVCRIIIVMMPLHIFLASAAYAHHRRVQTTCSASNSYFIEFFFP